MKKLILPLLCLFVYASAYGDDYSTTTILNNPVGVFENLTVSGSSIMSAAEIGARPETTAKPVKQTQNLTVYGTADLLPSGGSKIQVGGNLYLLGGRQYSFSTVYVYSNSLLYLSSSTSGLSLSTNEIDAKYINTFSSFTEGTDSSAASTLNISAGTPFRVGTLKFWDGSNTKTLEDPRPYGSRGVWVAVEGGDSADEYGPWIYSETNPGDTCSGNDYVNEYTCPTAANNVSCTDVRQAYLGDYSSTIKDYYTTTGGVYFSQARGRSECTYASTTDTCTIPTTYNYVGVDGGPAPSNVCPVTATDISNAINNNNLGALCYVLCGDKECAGASSCVVDTDNISAASSGSGGQAGTATCARTSWAASSGLECTNAWKEKSVRVLYCGAGSGKKYAANVKFYQKRSVKCSTGTAGSSPGTFLTVDFEH